MTVAKVFSSVIFLREEGMLLGLALAASLNAPIPETKFGVFRM